MTTILCHECQSQLCSLHVPQVGRNHTFGPITPSRSFLNLLSGNRLNVLVLRDLMDLYAYCVDDFTGYGFLSSDQVALINTIGGFSVESITDINTQRRILADQIDSNPTYQPLQVAFSTLGVDGLDQYNNFLSNIYPNLSNGASFAGSNGLGYLAYIFQYLQTADNPAAMRVILESIGKNASDQQRFEIQLTFEWAAQYNTTLVSAEVVALLWGAKAIYSDIIAARNVWQQGSNGATFRNILDNFVRSEAGGIPPLRKAFFKNKMVEKFAEEMAEARSVGYYPIRIGDEAFEAAANSGTMKYVVLSPKFINGVEIKHSVLANGGGVVAAGEVEISVVGGHALGGTINRASGHYLPDIASIETAREAFAELGIIFY